MAASVFIYIAGDGAGNGPKPIVSWNLRGRLRVGTGNQASVNVVSRFFNFWCDLEDTISRIETLPEGACSFLIADSKVINTQFSIVLALGNLKRMTKMISSNSYLGESIKGILKDHSTLQMQEQM